MIRFKTLLLFLCFGNFLFLGTIAAQETEEEVTDDLGNVSDSFQQHFFEALKQKGIENYELAIDALAQAEKAAKGDPESVAAVRFELGKNQKHLKQYNAAEENFIKVLAVKKEQVDVMEALYDLYYRQKDYANAIPLVQKLITYDSDYKEDLANLYHRTKAYEKALALLDELDESWGETSYRNALRRQIYKATGDSDGAIKDLETKIDKNPKKEQDYLNLIYLYSEQGETAKAFETAKELLRNQPKSHLAHLALYKFYLAQGDTEAAVKSMHIVFESSKIDTENKYKVLSDYLNFVGKHPELETELDDVVSKFATDGSGKVYEQLGGYYRSKGNKDAALKFYEQGAELDEDNFGLLKNTLLLQIEMDKLNEALNLSENGLTVFPAQPLLYLINGVANNRLEQADAAIDALETGVDFLFDDPKMEKDFYEQLSIAYVLKGNRKKADEYTQKASAINLEN